MKVRELKEETRKVFRDRFIGNEDLDLLKPANGVEFECFFNTLIEKVIDAVEEEIAQPPIHFPDETSDFDRGWKFSQDCLKASFKILRGV